MTRDQIKQLAEQFFKDTLNELEEDRLMGVGVSSCPKNEDELDAYLEALQDSTAEMKEALAYSNHKMVDHLANDLLSRNGITLQDDQVFSMLCREIMKQVIRVNKIEERRAVGDYSDDLVISPPHAPSDNIDSIDTSPQLSSMIDKFIEDYKRKESANLNTISEYESLCATFLQIVGDKPVTSITRDNLREYQDTLKKLPPHINKSKIYKGKTIAQILEMNPSKTLGVSSISKHIVVVKALFTWMVQEEVIDKNISDVLKPPPKKEPVDEQRKVFDTEDLQKLVKGLLDEEKQGNLKGRPERLWIPLISLFSGMRLNEICQLHTTDVLQINDVWCFKVAADDEGEKKLKTKASKRIVPIYPTLIDLGFLDHCQQMKDEPRLWMNLSKGVRGYHKNFSNWFLRSFLRTYITDDEKKNFHSFRHTFINTLKQLEVEETIIAEIVGHENSSITMSRYGKKYDPSKYLEKMELIDYGVDFSLLRAIATKTAPD